MVMVLVKEVIQGKYCCGWIVVEGNPHAELKNKTKNYFEAQKEKAKTKTNKQSSCRITEKKRIEK